MAHVNLTIDQKFYSKPIGSIERKKMKMVNITWILKISNSQYSCSGIIDAGHVQCTP